MNFAERMPPGRSPSAAASRKPPDSPTALIESLIVDLLAEARRQLAQLAQSSTGSDTDDDRQNRENARLRASNARTLGNIVEIVRKVMDLQLQLEAMGRIKSARKTEAARASLQRKIARVVADLGARGLLAEPDG